MEISWDHVLVRGFTLYVLSIVAWLVAAVTVGRTAYEGGLAYRILDIWHRLNIWAFGLVVSGFAIAAAVVLLWSGLTY